MLFRSGSEGRVFLLRMGESKSSCIVGVGAQAKGTSSRPGEDQVLFDFVLVGRDLYTWHKDLGGCMSKGYDHFVVGV